MKARPAPRLPAAVLSAAPDVAHAVPEAAKLVTVGSAVLGYWHGPRRRKLPFNQDRQRIRDLEALIRHRHGRFIDTDDGEIYVQAVAPHVESLDELIAWAARWAPAVDAEEAAPDFGTSPRVRLRADVLGRSLRLTRAERDAIGITTIGAIDFTKAQRTAERNRKKRQRKADMRKAAGATPRVESASQTKPWLAAGYATRRTWERHGKKASCRKFGPNFLTIIQAFISARCRKFGCTNITHSWDRTCDTLGSRRQPLPST